MSPGKRLQFAPCPGTQVATLQRELGLTRVLAEAMVRRGRTDPAQVLAFLELEGSLHDPLLLGDARLAITILRDAIAARGRIVVHGDYDADGVCATAILCEGLTALGARVEPFIPSRFEEGYGLAVATVERLHADGVSVLVTVDCGITAVEAASRARELGLALIITDHHRQGEAPTVEGRAAARRMRHETQIPGERRPSREGRKYSSWVGRNELARNAARWGSRPRSPSDSLTESSRRP